MGTHFNINAYTDEETVRTTLVEGTVKVSNANGSILIKPGEQAMKLKRASTYNVIRPSNGRSACLEKRKIYFQKHKCQINYASAIAGMILILNIK